MQKVLSNKLIFGIMLMILAFLLPLFAMFGTKTTAFAADDENPIEVFVVNYQNNGESVTQLDSVKQNEFAVLNSFNELETKEQGSVVYYFNGRYDGGEKHWDPLGNFDSEHHGYSIMFDGKPGLAFFNTKQQKYLWFPQTTQDAATAYHQAIQIKVGDASSSNFTHLAITVKFNGTKLYSAGIVDQGTTQYYSHIYHGLNSSIIEDAYLDESFYTHEDAVENAGPVVPEVEGFYEIALEYRTTGQTVKNASFSFYLVTSNTYENNEDSVLFDYTDKKVLKSKVEDLTNESGCVVEDDEILENYSTYHYFYHTDYGTTLRDNTVINSSNVPQNLVFPTISFNPEKYNVTYSRTLYSYKEYGEFSFSAQNSSMYGEAVLKIYDSNKILISTTNPPTEIARKTKVFTNYVDKQISNNHLVNIKVNYNPLNPLAPNPDSDGNYVVPSELRNGEYCVLIKGQYYYYNRVSQEICEFDLSASFSLEWTFTELGDYDFEKKFKLKIGNTGDESDYIIADMDNMVSSIKNFVKNEMLYLKGFQAIYAKDGNNFAYLQNEKYKNDFSYLNGSLASDVVLVNPDEDASTYQIEITNGTIQLLTHTKNDQNDEMHTFLFDPEKVASTNQPPIQFRYNAELNNASQTSWYVYQNSKGEKTLGAYNFSTKFNNAGLYVVFVSFKNYMMSDPEACSQQMFVFRITNTPPTVAIKTTTLNSSESTSLYDLPEDQINEIGVGEFTNKHVFLSWETSNIFNAQITATYSFKEFGATTSNAPQSFNGLLYSFDENGNKVYDRSVVPTIFTRNGHYTIKIYYTNSGSSLTKTFTIDNESISGIKALRVDPLQRTLYNKQINEISSLENFSLTTNYEFAWTWNQKASGASITATYYQANIANIPNYKFASIVNDNSELGQWILANGNFGLLNVGQNYTHTKVSSENASTVTFSSSQIIKTNKLGLLLLQDEAGNTSFFVTILDTTKAQQIQKTTTGQTSTSSLISETTEFVWGSHKALEISTGETENDDILDFASPDVNAITFNGVVYNIPTRIRNALNDNFKTSTNSQIYYINRVTDVSITVDTDETTTSISIKPSIISGKNVFVVIDNNYNTYLASSYDKNTNTGTKLPNSPTINLIDQEDTSVGKSVLLSMFLKDSIGNENNGTPVQISLDQSQGRIFSFSNVIDFEGDTFDEVLSNTINNPLDEYGKSQANRLQLFNNYSTNRDFLTFSFLQQDTGIFIVKKIVLQFYQLNYDKNSPNYPYSSNCPTDPGEDGKVLWKDGSQTSSVTWTNKSILDSNDNRQNYYVSSALNPSGNGTSQAGMYIITRYYVDAFYDSDVSERKGDGTRTYVVFVDRCGVISVVDQANYNAGEEISLLLGTNTADYEDNQKVVKSFTNQTKAKNTFYDNFAASRNADKDSRSMPTSPAVRTNLLPAAVALLIVDDVAYKYVYRYQDPETGEILFNKSTLNKNAVLIALVQRFDPLKADNHSLAEQRIFTSAVLENDAANGIYAIKNLKNYLMSTSGVYRVLLFDTSNISINISGHFNWNTLARYDNSVYVNDFGPNCAEFSFKIGNYSPTVNAVTKSTSGYTNLTTAKISIDGTSESEKTYYYSGDNNVILTFTDTNDEYRAKIAYGGNDLELSRTLRYLSAGNMMTISSDATVRLNNVRTYNPNATEEEMKTIFSDIEIERIQGVFSGTYDTDPFLTTMRLSTKAQNGGILYYREAIANTSNRYVYYILLPMAPEVETHQADQIFSLSFHYIGNKPVDIEDIYYQGTINVYVDHTAPFQNVANLVNSDTYLTTTQKAQILEKLSDPDSELLTKYAFAVGPTFYLTSQGHTESNSVFYFKWVSSVYDPSIPQTVVPGSSAYERATQNKFSPGDSNYYRSSYYNSGKTGDYIFQNMASGYYDIIEYDKAENYRVYTIYLSSGGASLLAVGDNETNSNIRYEFITSFNGSTPNYTIKVGTKTQADYRGQVDFSDAEVIKNITLSSNSFEIKTLNINDAWFTVKYRVVNNNPSTNFNTITITPDSDQSQIIDQLNTFINNSITTGKLALGSKIQIIINNRGGNDIHFYLNTPGKALTLNDLNPDPRIKNQFSITLPADTFATQYTNFAVTRNGTRSVDYDDSNPKKSIAAINNNRNEPTTLVFNIYSGFKFYFSFTDNFGKDYLFIYPSTSGLVNEIVFEEQKPKTYNGISYTPNTVQFKYTTGGTDKFSLKITNPETGEILVNLNKLPYRSSSTSAPDEINDVVSAAEIYSNYFSESISGNNVVTLTFFALSKSHLVYEINFIDVDNNSYSYPFGIYTYAPTITLTDTSGIIIWNSATAEKVTSKTVVARWNNDTSLLFPVTIYLYDGQISKPITSPYTISQEGNYQIRTVSTLGTINQNTLSFTIKPATSQIYSVYFNETILNAHTDKYRYENTTTGEIFMINQYFFLSNSTTAFADSIKILPNEAQDLKIDDNPVIVGNTRIYSISGKVYKNYIAITQVYSSQSNRLTNFQIYTYTDTPGSSSTTPRISTNDYMIVLSPTQEGNTYANLVWTTTYTDSFGITFDNFVYLDITYNDTIYLGTFTSGNVNLEKSGKYTIKIFDVVGQVHRFGTSYAFTLTILNDIIYYINVQSPIEHATYNDAVVVSLPNTSNYQWNTTGKIQALRNNVEYKNFTADGTTWTFSEAGFYKIYLETKTTQTKTAEDGSLIYAEISFTILDPNEARKTYDFAKISGYFVDTIKKQIFNSELSNILQEIKTNYQTISADENLSKNVLNQLLIEDESLVYELLRTNFESDAHYFDEILSILGIETDNVFEHIMERLIEASPSYLVTELGKILANKNIDDYVYSFVDITQDVKDIFGNNLQSFSLTTENVGTGKFLITIMAADQTNKTTQNYSYFVWLNDKNPTINSSRQFGSASTASFTISYNPSILFEDVGNCVIKITYVAGNSNEQTASATINADSKDENKIVNLPTQAKAGTYFVQVYSQSGTLLSSQRITINEPMNTATIILIVVGVVVVVGIVVTFVMLRTKMKVK